MKGACQKMSDAKDMTCKCNDKHFQCERKFQETFKSIKVLVAAVPLPLTLFGCQWQIGGCNDPHAQAPFPIFCLHITHSDVGKG